MKLYRYWQVERAKVRVNGDEFELTCYGGSDFSDADAGAKAREKIEKVRRKIAGDAHAFDEYEVAIREETLRVIHEKAVITRTRYGAQVLNVEDLMIMDVDRPPFAFADLFRRRETARDKARILELVRKVARTEPWQGWGLRVYETFRGIRLIVLGRSFDPTGDETETLMRSFHTDGLYVRLCRKQACFRARLTPKPGRMKLKAYKVRFPRDEAEDREFKAWLKEYEYASREYSVCKLVEQIGPGEPPEAVRVHDQVSGVDLGLKLA